MTPRRHLTPGTTLTDRPATVEPERSAWWDDERAFVGTRPKWSLIIAAWLIPATIAVLQSTAGTALRGELAKDWPWVVLQVPRWLTWALVTPLIFSAAHRFPFSSDRLWRSVWTHLLIALAIAASIELVWLQITLIMQGYLEPEVLARARTNWAEVYSTVV